MALSASLHRLRLVESSVPPEKRPEEGHSVDSRQQSFGCLHVVRIAGAEGAGECFLLDVHSADKGDEDRHQNHDESGPVAEGERKSDERKKHAGV
jgi:hypothetical protein